MKIFVYNLNAYERVTSVEENINNQLEKMIHSMDTSQPFPPATSVIVQWTHEQSDHGGYV